MGDHCTRMRQRPRAGFTLVEIGIGIALGTVLCLGMMTLLKGGTRIFGTTSVHLESLQTAQMVSEIVREDLQFTALSGLMSKHPANPSSWVPDLTPFLYDDGTGTRPSGTEFDPERPVKMPDPLDLTENPGKDGTKFVLYRTFETGDAAKPYLLARVSYWLEPRKWKTWDYFYFCREVIDGEGKAVGNIPKVKVYKNLRVRHLLFLFHERDVQNVGGTTSFTPPDPPAGYMEFFQRTLALAADMVRRLFGGGGGGGGGGAGPDPTKPPRDYAYYVQYLVTGLSSTPNPKDFEDLQENLIVGVVSMDALAEKLRRENAALYWNTRAKGESYVTTGTAFETP